jgi:chromosome segregation ATPase
MLVPEKLLRYGERYPVVLERRRALEVPARREVLLDPIVTVLATAIGAIVGTSVGILLLRRQLRPPVTDAEFAELKSKLQSGESALTAASANLDDLRHQIAIQERALLQKSRELSERQEQLHVASAEAQKEKERRTTVEKTVQELSAKMAFVSDQSASLEARIREENELAATRAAHLATVESERDTGRQRIQEITEQLALLAFELEECKRSSEQETRFRTALEAQMKADQERIGQLTTQVAELQGERLQLEIRLKEETAVAKKGIEVLLAAQEKLSSVLKALGSDLVNGQHNPAPVGTTSPSPSLEVNTCVSSGHAAGATLHAAREAA